MLLTGPNASGKTVYLRTMALIAEEIKRDLLRKGLSVNDVLDAFEGFDRNHDGVCSYKEFKRALKQQLRINLHTKKLRQVWKMLDHDESGEVKYSEFAAALFPELEDDVLAVVHKPAGVHSKPFGGPLSLEHALPGLLSPPTHATDGLVRPTCVHRLDARVSGLGAGRQ